MANRQHNLMATSDLHTLIRWTVADSAARLALSVVAADIGKLCLQSDTGACYILTATTPVWLGLLILNTDGTGTTWTTNTQVVGAQAIFNFVFQGLTGYTPHTAVDCATTTVLPAGTYANGTAGVGATFTVTATGTLTIDGHLTILGDRVLVKNQVAGLQDGIYTVTTAGATGVQAVLTRATDADTSAELLNSIYAVLNGTVNAPAGVSTFWYVNNTAAIAIGTDAIGFTQIQTPSQGGGPPGNQVSAPLSKAGNTISMGAVDSLTAYITPVDADEVVVAKSASSFAVFKTTWANVKATLKTYFDTLYATIASVPAAANPTGTIGATAVNGSATTFLRSDGAPPLAIDAMTGKTTPVDADETVLADSASSFSLKKLSWSNIKATLKAYFDTLYTSVTLSSIVTDCATTSGSKVPAGTYVAGLYTATATGAVTIDGFALIAGSRVLDKDNTTAANQGAWVVSTAGALGVALVMSRAADMNQANEFYGALVEVVQGTTNGGTFWRETLVVTTVNTDPVAFNQVNFLPGANTVTNAMLAQAGAKTLKGNATSGTANVSDLTAPVVSGEMTASDFTPSGLTGAATASRYVGGVAGAAPTSGTFAVGDFVVDTTLGGVWTCMVAGTPGTWIYAGPSVVINAQTGTSYTLLRSDAGLLVTCNNATAIALTIPANASVAFPVGTVVNVLQLGAGRVTVGITSDTLNQANGLITVKQYSMVSLTKYTSTVWVLTGDSAAT